jgi:UDP-N-acetyl-D-mannosaminuronate dehydrogenase
VLHEPSLSSVELDPELADADLVAIVTAHPEIDYEAVVGEASLVLDFRGVTRGITAENLVRM